jgi:hypothetical protein
VAGYALWSKSQLAWPQRSSPSRSDLDSRARLHGADLATTVPAYDTVPVSTLGARSAGSARTETRAMDDATSSDKPETNSSIPVPAPSQSGLIPVDGVRLYYELFGSGYPVVLVPGAVADSRIWNDQVAAFAEHYMVVRFDLRGSGRSESGTEPFTYVSDMASMLRMLQVDPAYLVGIADGASLAVEYAVEYPLCWLLSS